MGEVAKGHGAAYTLIYPYTLPHVGDSMHWRVRFEQRRKAVRVFGELLPQLQATSRAHVTITRVLGPHQRPYDSDNLRTACKGLRDALKHCGYVVDDNPRWADFAYVEDDTRRHIGPRIEVRVSYDPIDGDLRAADRRAAGGVGAVPLADPAFRPAAASVATRHRPPRDPATGLGESHRGTSRQPRSH